MAEPASVEAQLKKAKADLRKLKKVMEAQQAARKMSEDILRRDAQNLKAALDDKSDRLLPQKQVLLKELAYLVNATSRAVRTTMWSLAPVERRGYGR